MEKRKTLLLKFSQNCFLCLKLRLPVEKGNIKKEIDLFPLRRIYRYLQLHPCSVKKKFEEFKMNLYVCDKCGKITEEFAQLHSILDETNLLIQVCIRKMLEIITEARVKEVHHLNNEESDEEDVIRSTKEKLVLNEDDESSRIIEELRKEIMLKGERKLKLAVPRVMMNRLRIPVLKQKSITPLSSKISVTPVKIEPSCVPIPNEDESSIDIDYSEALNSQNSTSKTKLEPCDQSKSDKDEDANSPSSPTSPVETTVNIKPEPVTTDEESSGEEWESPPSPPPPELEAEGEFDPNFNDDASPPSSPPQLSVDSPVVTKSESTDSNKVEVTVKKSTSPTPTPSSSPSRAETNDKDADLISDLIEPRQTPIVFPFYNKKIKSTDALPCPHCDKVIAATAKKKKLRLKEHIATKHRDILLPPVRQKNVPLPKFKRMIDILLNDCIKDDNCSFCTMKFSFKLRERQLQHVRMHLIEAHSPELGKKLVEIQKNRKWLQGKSQRKPGDEPKVRMKRKRRKPYKKQSSSSSNSDTDQNSGNPSFSQVQCMKCHEHLEYGMLPTHQNSCTLK